MTNELDENVLEDFLIYAQVTLANLDDAIYSDNMKGITKFSQELYIKADTLQINPISLIAKEIALRASLKRDANYTALFNELRESLRVLEERFTLSKEMLTC